MDTQLQKFRLTTWSLALLMSSAAIGDGLDHEDLLSCYGSVFVQCAVGDQECLDWGYDNCDDAYGNSIIDINGSFVVTRKGSYKPKGRMKTTAGQIRQSVKRRK